jgi:hypothetical protein
VQNGSQVIVTRPRFAGQIARAAAAVSIAFGFGVGAAATAHASPALDLTQVCKENYKQPTAKVDRLPGHDDPYSFYCYIEDKTATVGIPSGVSDSITKVSLGDLDVQAFCNRHHGGAPATGHMRGSQPYWTCGKS